MKIDELTINELADLKNIIKGVISDYDFMIENKQKLNNLHSIEKQLQDKDFISMCEKRQKYQKYSFALNNRIEQRINEIFND